MEHLDTINSLLKDRYGIDTITGLANFRVVWSSDQLEKRLMHETDNGVQLLTPEIREVKKYSYVMNRYILERLTLVPPQNMAELAGAPISYEPLWVFQDKNHNALSFRFDVCEIVIDAVYRAMGFGGNSPRFARDSVTSQKERVDKLQEELFGDESRVTDALTHKSGIIVPSSYQKD